MNDKKIKPESGASADAIEFHYGTGNDYFALWLGESMAYSCALWNSDDESQSLDDAQRAKIRYHCEQARAKDAQSVLDIGCGWGGVLQALVNDYGVTRAVGLTLSDSQLEWVNQLGSTKIEARLESWKDHDPDVQYDSIISIGAFEHFAKLGLSEKEKVKIYREFFTRCHGWLGARGWMSLQTVAYGNSLPKDFDQFIAKEIFPETDTPRLVEIAAGAEYLFEVVALRNDRDDYRRTLRAWFSRLKENRVQAVELKGEEEVQRFEQYLRLMAYMFEVGGLDLHRITLRKIDKPKVA
ncbi:MAG: class I SAM-dependent methyltransferase [Proteobacteria bacterium]|jgi:cyclopropane-fatty-acyl-phospholipid synthase|nr:class I SAM-dependent methyltransferase [Pseudomonadota bacterium]